MHCIKATLWSHTTLSIHRSIIINLYSCSFLFLFCDKQLVAWLWAKQLTEYYCNSVNRLLCGHKYTWNKKYFNKMGTISWKSYIVIPVLCVTSIVVLSKTLFRKKSKSTKVQIKPEKWVKVGTVKRLIIYPIKSCAGALIEKGEITRLGLGCMIWSVINQN